MEFYEPRSVSEAVALLAANGEAICFAGGASLVAMMNARLVEPEEIVSLRHIEELDGIVSDGNGWVRIGAMATHDEIARFSGFQGGQSVMALAASRIGHPAIREMGTIGGAVSLADPAADYPPALVACDARIEIAGSKARRDVAAADFFRGYFDTELEAGEIVTAVIIPSASPASGASFVKFARVEGDYATISVAVLLAFEGEICRQANIAIGACGPVPTRLPEAEANLIGTHMDPAALAAAGGMIARACNAVDDLRGTAGFRRRIIPELIRRAANEARSSIEQSS